jgi:hypothetical protein
MKMTSGTERKYSQQKNTFVHLVFNGRLDLTRDKVSHKLCGNFSKCQTCSSLLCCHRWANCNRVPIITISNRVLIKICGKQNTSCFANHKIVHHILTFFCLHSVHHSFICDVMTGCDANITNEHRYTCELHWEFSNASGYQKKPSKKDH